MAAPVQSLPLKRQK